MSEQPQKTSLVDWLVGMDKSLGSIPRKWIGLRLAQKAVLLDDTQKVLAENRRAVETFNKKTMGNEQPKESVDDSVHVGDSITNIHNPEPKPVVGFPKWLGIGLALLALGTGIGGGALGLMALLKTTKTVVQEPAEWIIKWKIENGKVKTWHEPVQKP